MRKSEGQTDDDPTYWLRFVNVQVTNDRDLPLYVLLSRSAANDLEDTAAVKQLESTAETILLDDGPEGQWKGTQLRPTMEQELRLFDVMAFSSIIICKPSAAKPPSVQPLIFAYGVFQSYTPPEKSAAQILQETNALAEKLMHTMIDMEQDELRDQDDLALDALQRNAKQLFRMFDEDKSNSIDFEGNNIIRFSLRYQRREATITVFCCCRVQANACVSQAKPLGVQGSALLRSRRRPKEVSLTWDFLRHRST